VLVHVWITGAGDSLVSIGITLGDTTGALGWIEEDADSFYTTPAGWANIPGHVDSRGRVLIQAADFGHSTPLILPSQVAELKFTMAPGESCGTIGWDPEESGWMDWEFTEGALGPTAWASVCREQVQDGGLEEPAGSDSEVEVSSGEDIPGGPGPGGEGGNTNGLPSSFVRRFEVPDEDYLFVHGHRIRGAVECRWTQGGALVVNGYQVLPAPTRLHENRPDEYYRSHYAGYPFVESQVDSGISWREASRAWMDTVLVLERRIAAAYRVALSSSGSSEEAQQAAERVIAELSPNLVDHTVPARWLNGMLCVPWLGQRYCSWLRLSGETLMAPPVSQTPSYWTALSLVTNVRELLRAPGPSIFVMPSAGGATGEASNDPIHAENVEAWLAQIRGSSQDNILPGGLPDYALREILEEGGLLQ
jgi:hypothetical protein